jgi:hypothetical protein
MTAKKWTADQNLEVVLTGLRPVLARPVLPQAGSPYRMLAEIGDNRRCYCDYQALQCEAGTATVTIASGN